MNKMTDCFELSNGVKVPCLGFGTYHPYGFWFYFLVFLECLIALLNNGIVLVYAFQFLFGKRK